MLADLNGFPRGQLAPVFDALCGFVVTSSPPKGQVHRQKSSAYTCATEFANAVRRLRQRDQQVQESRPTVTSDIVGGT